MLCHTAAAHPMQIGIAPESLSQGRTMIRTSYRLQLATPAFLGDADQKGVWRTPPLKALIREWWRVAVAPAIGHDDVRKLKQKEADLFGTAADDNRNVAQKIPASQLLTR